MRWYWFKFNNLGLALDMAFKFYTSVAKELRLKFIMFSELIPTFVEVTREKLVGGSFWTLPPPPIVNMVKREEKILLVLSDFRL